MDKTVWPPSSGANSIALQNEIAFIGDSRCYYGYRNFFRTAATTNSKNVQLFFDGVGHDVLTGTSGTLEFRASDKAFRWTAPSDTAGEWVALGSAGWMTLQSGTANKELRVATQIYSNLPSTDQTITVDITTTAATKYIGYQTSAAIQVYSKLRCNVPYKIIGIGGLKTIGLKEALPYYATVAGARGGIDVIRIGTNDISDGTITAATMIANATEIFNTRLALGRKLVIVGEPARWGVNTTTALTAQQLADIIAYNKALRDFANANPANCVFVDLYGISVDPAYKDGRPYTNYLRDIVHDGFQGTIDFGNAIYTAVKKFGVEGNANYPYRGETSIYSNGFMTGTTGTIGTGASGSAPTGYTLSRTSGSDATVVGSIFNKLTPWRAYGATLTITGTTATNVITFRTAGQTLSTLGLAVGDTINYSIDIEVVSATNITSVVSNMQFNDSPQTMAEIDFVPLANSASKLKSCDIVIPVGATTLAVYNLITVGASSSAVINISDIIITKVS